MIEGTLLNSDQHQYRYSRKNTLYCRFYSVKVNYICFSSIGNDKKQSFNFIENFNYNLGYITLVSNKRECLHTSIMSNHKYALGNFIEMNIDSTLKRNLSMIHNKGTMICTSVDLHSTNGIVKL